MKAIPSPPASVEIQAQDTIIRSIPEIPSNARSIVVFAHGAGSNRSAGARMNSQPMLEVVHGASHLFGAPGKLEQAASMSYI